MADQRPALSSDRAREVRNNLVDAITQHERDAGSIPNVQAAEQLVNPIMRQIEVEHEEDRTKDLVRPKSRVGPAQQKALADPNVRLINRVGPTFVIEPETGALRKVIGEVRERPTFNRSATVGEDDLPTEIVAASMRAMRSDPDWRTQMDTAVFAARDGNCTPTKDCTLFEMCPDHGMKKANAILAVVRRWLLVHGDPRKPSVPKILVVQS